MKSSRFRLIRKAKRKIENKRRNPIVIFGFEIDRKASFTSLAAFVLSIWGVGQATFYYLNGSELKLIKPERIIAFRDACHTKSGETINFLIPISIVNTSVKSYSSVLSDVQLKFNLDREYNFDSEAYANFGSSTPQKYGLTNCNPDKNAQFFIEETKVAPAEVVLGGEALVKNVIFVPTIPNCAEGGNSCYLRNYIPTALAIEKLESMASINFSISIKYDEDKFDTKDCEILLNSDVVNAIKEHKYFDVFCKSQR